MNPYLLVSIGTGPSVIRRLVAMISPDQIDVALADDRFTVREVVSHMADWEVLFRARMDVALNTPNAPIVTYDEGDRAVERNYASLDLDEQLNAYCGERGKTVALVKSLSREQMELAFIHPANGRTTIKDQANMLIGHDMYHIEQLTAYLV